MIYQIDTYLDIVPAYSRQTEGLYIRLQDVVLGMVEWCYSNIDELSFTISEETFWNRDHNTVPLPRKLYIIGTDNRVAFKLKFGV